MPTKFMKLGFEDLVLNEEEFYNIKINNKIVGFNLDLRMNFYRGLPVSCIEELEVEVDGEFIPHELMIFCINGKKFAIRDLERLFSEYWGIKTPAQLRVYNDGLSSGEHKVNLKMIIRCPYMQFGPRTYGKIDSSCSKTMTIKGGKEIDA